MDLFRKKLASDWIGNHFSNAPKKKPGDSLECAEKNFERALRFVSNKFEKRAKEAGRKKDLAIFETTAVDSKNARAALNAVWSRYDIFALEEIGINV